MESDSLSKPKNTDRGNTRAPPHPTHPPTQPLHFDDHTALPPPRNLRIEVDKPLPFCHEISTSMSTPDKVPAPATKIPSLRDLPTVTEALH